jgi:hypothetical protein
MSCLNRNDPAVKKLIERVGKNNADAIATGANMGIILIPNKEGKLVESNLYKDLLAEFKGNTLEAWDYYLKLHTPEFLAYNGDWISGKFSKVYKLDTNGELILSSILDKDSIVTVFDKVKQDGELATYALQGIKLLETRVKILERRVQEAHIKEAKEEAQAKLVELKELLENKQIGAGVIGLLEQMNSELSKFITFQNASNKYFHLKVSCY